MISKRQLIIVILTIAWSALAIYGATSESPLIAERNTYVALELTEQYYFAAAIMVAWNVLVVTAVYIYALFPLTGMGFRHMFQAWISKYLDRTAETPRVSPQCLRSIYNETPTVRTKMPKEHTHSESAADRSSASVTIDLFSDNVGYTPYYVQRSRSDERHGRAGSRAYYWNKDLQTTPETFSPSENNLLAFVDVDQYIDMPYLLCKEFKPTLIYTFQPSAVASVEPEYSFTFDDTNTVDYRVNGGARYSHQVWNYSSDNLMAIVRFMGIPVWTATYLIDKRTTSNHHDLILMTPVKKWTGISAIISSILYGNELVRLEIAQDGYLRMKIQKDRVMMSTAKVGTYSCATVDITIDEAIASVARTSSLDLTLPQVLKQLSDAGSKDTATSHALALMEFHRQSTPRKVPFVYPIKQSVKHYTFGRIVTDEDRRSVVPFMSPMMPEAFAPMSGPNNEKRAIGSRITDINQLEVIMTPFLYRVNTEFNKRLIPVPHLMHPADHDEVYRRQGRPAQRRILITGETTNSTDIVQSFVKKETYSSPNDPRVISTINGNDKLEYSTFTYPMAELYAKQKWYAFSKTPIQIAEHASRACQHSLTMALGDFSRMDGHCNEIDRAINKMTMTRAFNPRYHDEMLERMESQYDVRGFGQYGTKYHSEYQRLSGSPETACFNSDITARTVFTGYRMSVDPSTGKFFTADAAWAKLTYFSMVGGDDSYAGDLEPEIFIKAAALYGQVLEVDVVRRGDYGFNFLSRFYTDRIWYGETASTCDLQRQLRKFHVTVKLPTNVTPVMKLVEKSRSFYMSDRNTPVLGPLVTYVKRLADVRGMAERNDLNIFTLSTDLDNQYPNDINDDDLKEEIIRSKLNPECHEIMLHFLNCNPTLEEIIDWCPLVNEPTPELPKLKDTVVIDDGNFQEVHEVKTTDTTTTGLNVSSLPPLPALPKQAPKKSSGAQTARATPHKGNSSRRPRVKGKQKPKHAKESKAVIKPSDSGWI